jgi:hypothetical protein
MVSLYKALYESVSLACLHAKNLSGFRSGIILYADLTELKCELIVFKYTVYKSGLTRLSSIQHVLLNIADDNNFAGA